MRFMSKTDMQRESHINKVQLTNYCMSMLTNDSHIHHSYDWFCQIKLLTNESTIYHMNANSNTSIHMLSKPNKYVAIC